MVFSRWLPFYLASLLLLFISCAQASETLLSLSASSQREVSNDQISATFYQQASHAQPAVLANQLNSAAAQGMALAKHYPQVQLSSGNYNTWPNYDKNGKIQGWQGRVEIQLKSRDFTQAAELMAKLQQSMLLQGLQFSISDAARRTAEREMIPEAIANLQAQAEIAAKALGKAVNRVRELEIGNTPPSFRPMMIQRAAKMASRDEVLPTEFQAGESQLQLQISGKVELN
ncbi:SIMPL domain-containing protein [Neisseriaceae bacterium TC5R-5]|nr:SIMPL domain-containing protein [Neisseriaceae bacterium TC5R-5]